MIRRGPDDERRRLLATTDRLLDRIEELRLADNLMISDRLRAQLAAVAEEIGGQSQRRVPATLAGAHDHVFRLQTKLLQAGDRPARQPLPGQSSDAPSTTLRPMSLPERGRSKSDAEWLEEVRLTVQRAHDRASYLAAQAEAANALPFANAEHIAGMRRTQAVEAQNALDDLIRDAERIAERPMRIDPLPRLPAMGRFEVGDVVIDQDRRVVLKAGRPVRLLRPQRDIIATLAANPTRVVTSEALQHVVTRADPLLDVRSSMLRVHVAYLRSQLGRGYVDTVTGIGYRLSSALTGSARSREERRAQRDAQVRRSSSQSTRSPSSRPATDHRGAGR